MKEINIKYEQKNMSLDDLSETEIKLLKRSIEISKEAKEAGNHPFGCLLADKDGNILMEQGNTENDGICDCTGHAETQLMKRATLRYSKEQMKEFSLYSCAEPCAMCSGAMYWGNLGKLYYAARESELKKVTGDDPRNPTLDLPCRAVFARGQKDIEVFGPFVELEESFFELHRGYWG